MDKFEHFMTDNSISHLQDDENEGNLKIEILD